MKWPICCWTDDMSKRTCLVLYKQMQSNTFISFWSQTFKAVDVSQLACVFRRSIIQTERKIMTLLGYAKLPFGRKQSCAIYVNITPSVTSHALSSRMLMFSIIKQNFPWDVSWQVVVPLWILTLTREWYECDNGISRAFTKNTFIWNRIRYD